MWAGFYLNPEIENCTKIIYSYHSIAQRTERKKRLENMRHICLPAKPHASHQASRGMVSCPPHAVSFVLALYFLSVLLSFPDDKWSLAYVPVQMYCLLMVQLIFVGFFRTLKCYLLRSVTSNSFLYPLLPFHWFESLFLLEQQFFNGSVSKNYWIHRIFQLLAFFHVTLTYFLKPFFLLDDFCRIACLFKARMKDEYCTKSFSKLLS